MRRAAKGLLAPAGLLAAGALVLRWVARRQRRGRGGAAGRMGGGFSFRGKHVLITGGSSGIGQACAELLAAEGARVTILARDPGRLEAAAAAIRAAAAAAPDGRPAGLLSGAAAGAAAGDDPYGGGPFDSVFAISADVTDAAAVAAAVAEAEARFGTVDVLLCSAGVATPRRFEDTPPSEFERVMRTNWLGCVHAVKAALPGVRRAGPAGRIVLVSSQAGQVGLFGYTAYASSKFALRGFAEALQMELRPSGVRVGLAFPPDTDTPQLAAEKAERPPELAAIASSPAFTPRAVAGRILAGARRGAFTIPIGLDGWMLANVTCGMAPQPNPLAVLVEILLLPLLRIIGLAYVAYFNGIVRSHAARGGGGSGGRGGGGPPPESGGKAH